MGDSPFSLGENKTRKIAGHLKQNNFSGRLIPNVSRPLL